MTRRNIPFGTFSIFFRGPWTLADARAALGPRYAIVRETADSFTLQDASGPSRIGPRTVARPELTISLRDGPQACEIAGRLASQVPALASCDRYLYVLVHDLATAQDEVNTLIDVQLTLQELTHGFLHLHWNGILQPWEPSTSG